MMIMKPEDFKHMLAWPTVLVSTCNKTGQANAAPYGCVMPVLRPLDLVSFASAYPRHTLQNIRETKEFVLNIPGVELAKETMLCAQPFAAEVNEIKQCGLQEMPSAKIKVPRIAECLGWMECLLEEEIARENYVLVVGKVVHAEVKEEYCLADGSFDLSKYQPIYSGWQGKMVTMGKAECWNEILKGEKKNG